MAQAKEIMLRYEVERAIARAVAFALNNANMQRQESVPNEIANPHLDRPRSSNVLGEAPNVVEVYGHQEVEERKEGLQASASISRHRRSDRRQYTP